MGKAPGTLRQACPPDTLYSTSRRVRALRWMNAWALLYDCAFSAVSEAMREDRWVDAHRQVDIARRAYARFRDASYRWEDARQAERQVDHG